MYPVLVVWTVWVSSTGTVVKYVSSKLFVTSIVLLVAEVTSVVAAGCVRVENAVVVVVSRWVIGEVITTAGGVAADTVTVVVLVDGAASPTLRSAADAIAIITSIRTTVRTVLERFKFIPFPGLGPVWV